MKRPFVAGIRCTAILTWCVLLGGAAQVSAEILPGWSTNTVAAFNQARTGQKPLLIWFTASWCGPCRMMARTTLVEPAVTQALTNLVCLVVDIDQQQAFAAKRGVQAVPTFQLFAASGEMVVSHSGYQPALEFIQWVTRGLDQAGEAESRRAEAEQKLAATAQLWSKNDSGSRSNAIAALLDLYANASGPVRDTIHTQLVTCARSQPGLLLQGLNHRWLMVRLETANLLRGQWGEAFGIDPWDTAEARAKAVNEFHEPRR